jgi:hypothetical protein
MTSPRAQQTDSSTARRRLRSALRGLRIVCALAIVLAWGVTLCQTRVAGGASALRERCRIGMSESALRAALGPPDHTYRPGETAHTRQPRPTERALLVWHIHRLGGLPAFGVLYAYTDAADRVTFTIFEPS